MSHKIEDLAVQIVSLAPADQEALLEKVADLNYQYGLEQLSLRYRERLACEDQLHKKADKIMEELGKIRENIAAHEYQN